MPSNLQSMITWDFVVSSQVGTVRYGHLNEIKYKQVIGSHYSVRLQTQPKRVPDRLYANASKVPGVLSYDNFTSSTSGTRENKDSS